MQTKTKEAQLNKPP